MNYKNDLEWPHFTTKWPKVTSNNLKILDYQQNEAHEEDEAYDDYQGSLPDREGRIYENGFESLGKDATLPPPVQLTQRWLIIDDSEN